MCNDYEQHLEWKQFCAAVEQSGLTLSDETGPRDLPIIDDVRVRDKAPVLMASGISAQLQSMIWGLPGRREKAPPVFNFRSENRSFADSKRCIVPASAFFEFTGARYPKSKWRFSLVDQAPLGLAGLWREDPSSVRYFTLLTTEAGIEVAKYHDRQVVVLRPSDWARWLYLEAPEDELLQPLEEGALSVCLARAGSD